MDKRYLLAGVALGMMVCVCACQNTNQEGASRQNASVAESTTAETTTEEPTTRSVLAGESKLDLNQEVKDKKQDKMVAYGDIVDMIAERNQDEIDLRDYELTVEQQKDLLEITDGVKFHWIVNVLGVEIDSDDTTADISGHDVANLVNCTMDDVFAVLPNLTRIDMCQCGMDNDYYANLQDNHPEIRIIWEIVMSHWTIRTDRVAFSSMKDCSQTFFMNDSEAKYFKYCTDMIALDLGHNHVGDISFLQYMPELRVLILVDNVKSFNPDGTRTYTNDLSVLKYCPKLKYLEFFVGNVRDLSFLQYTPDIVDLNISYNPISDATYLYNLPKLERLWMEHTGISDADFQALKAHYPNAQIELYGEGSIDHGWREHPRYFQMRDQFNNNYLNDVFR